MKSHYKSHLYLLLSALGWGSSIIVLKLLVVETPLNTINFFRFFIAGLFLFLINIREKELFKLNKETFFILNIQSITGVALYYGLETIGLQYISASLCAIIIGTIPLMLLIVELYLKNEKFSFLKFSVVIISITGIIFTVLGEQNSEHFYHNYKGYSLIFLANISWICYIYYIKNKQVPYSNLKTVAFQMLFASFYFLPGTIYEFVLDKSFIFSKDVYIKLLILALPSSAFAYFFYNLGIKNIDNSTSALYLNFIPVISIILGLIFLKESFNSLKILGISFIIMSILISFYFSTKNLKKKYLSISE